MSPAGARAAAVGRAVRLATGLSSSGLMDGPLGLAGAHAGRGPLLEATSAECISGPKTVSNENPAARPPSGRSISCQMRTGGTFGGGSSGVEARGRMAMHSAAYAQRTHSRRAHGHAALGPMPSPILAERSPRGPIGKVQGPAEVPERAAHARDPDSDPLPVRPAPERAPAARTLGYFASAPSSSGSPASAAAAAAASSATSVSAASSSARNGLNSAAGPAPSGPL